MTLHREKKNNMDGKPTKITRFQIRTQRFSSDFNCFSNITRKFFARTANTLPQKKDPVTIEPKTLIAYSRHFRNSFIKIKAFAMCFLCVLFFMHQKMMLEISEEEKNISEKGIDFFCCKKKSVYFCTKNEIHSVFCSCESMHFHFVMEFHSIHE